MAHERAAGVILAAGRSSRMGRPKALIELEGESILSRLARVYASASIDPILLVASGETLLRARSIPGVEPVEGDPSAPMIDSMARALALLPSATGAVLQPVDAPFTTREMIARLLEDPHAPRALTFEGVPGHPVYVPRRLFAEIQSRPEGGLRGLLAREPTVMLEWSDRRVLADLDTPEDVMLWFRADDAAS